MKVLLLIKVIIYKFLLGALFEKLGRSNEAMEFYDKAI